LSPQTAIPEGDTTAAGPMLSLKVSMPGKFSHLPLNKDLVSEGPKSGTLTAIQQLINKVTQKTDPTSYKREMNIESMKTHRDHSPPKEGPAINQLLSGPMLPASSRGGDRRD